MQNTKIKDTTSETKDTKIKIKRQSNSFVNQNPTKLNNSCNEINQSSNLKNNNEKILKANSYLIKNEKNINMTKSKSKKSIINKDMIDKLDHNTNESNININEKNTCEKK